MKRIDKLVSVIINTHNGAKFLEKSIKSVINQDYANFEIIIWDNASQDNTKEVISNFSDKRLKYYYSSKFLKLYEARNEALKKAQGSFITFLDVDDEITQKSLSARINHITITQTFICYSNLFISKNFSKKKLFYKKKMKSGNIFENLLKDYNVCFLSLMFRREVFEKEKFNSTYDVIGDFDFVLKTSKNYDISYCKEPSGIYNIFPSNYSNSHEDLHAKELKKWFFKNYKFILQNKKNFKQIILYKYLVLHKFYKLKDKKLLFIIIYFIKLKKNYFFYLLLRKYLSFLKLKYIK